MVVQLAHEIYLFTPTRTSDSMRMFGQNIRWVAPD